MRRTSRISSLGLTPRLAVAVAAAMLGVAGCFQSGPTISTVSGKVTLDGQPVTDAVINFASESGFGVQVKLAEDGTYAFQSQYGKGIPLGSYKVSIAPPWRDPREAADPTAMLSGVSPPDYSRIPKRYRSFNTSGFTAEVKEGGNVFNFGMKR